MTTSTAAISATDFDALLNDIAGHHLGNLKPSANSLPTQNPEKLDLNAQKAPPPQAASATNTPAFILQYQEACQNDLKTNCNGYQSKITQYTQELQNSDDESDFQNKISAMSNQAKGDYQTDIDKWKSNAKSLYTQHPDFASEILTTYSKALHMAAEIFNKFGNFLSDILTSNSDWLKDAWESIKVFFSNANNTIDGWF